MPKLIPPLSELQVKKAKPADQPYRLADGKGLYLQVMPNGSKYWRMKYRIGEKEKAASFGVYAEVSLAEAREACIAARKQISAGIDPSAQKQQVKREKAIEAASSFEIVAREWFANQKDGWSEVYAGKVINSLEVDVFPESGQSQSATSTRRRCSKSCGQSNRAVCVKPPSGFSSDPALCSSTGS